MKLGCLRCPGWQCPGWADCWTELNRAEQGRARGVSVHARPLLGRAVVSHSLRRSGCTSPSLAFPAPPCPATAAAGSKPQSQLSSSEKRCVAFCKKQTHTAHLPFSDTSQKSSPCQNNWPQGVWVFPEKAVPALKNNLPPIEKK